MLCLMSEFDTVIVFDFKAGQDSRADQPLVGHRPTHATDEDHRPRRLQPPHLPRDRLRRHEDTSDVYAKHLVGVLHGVLEGGCLLLDASAREQAVDAAVLLGDPLDRGVEADVIAHVDPTELNAGAQGLGALLDAVEVRVWLLQPVKSVDLCACLEERLALDQAQASASSSHDDDLVF